MKGADQPHEVVCVAAFQAWRQQQCGPLPWWPAGTLGNVGVFVEEEKFISIMMKRGGEVTVEVSETAPRRPSFFRQERASVSRWLSEGRHDEKVEGSLFASSRGSLSQSPPPLPPPSTALPFTTQHRAATSSERPDCISNNKHSHYLHPSS
jgi:hypothetical protein